MKREYESGKKARENFERTMTVLFRLPKDAAKKPEKSSPRKRLSRSSITTTAGL